MSEELLRPAEVCRRLAMPASTLRIYSTKFGELLSETARAPVMGGEGRTGFRLYSSRDLLVLSRAKELLGQGLTYDQTLRELRLAVPGAQAGRKEERASGVEGMVERREEVMAELVEVLRGAVRNGEKALEACLAMVRREEREIEELRERVARLEEQIREVKVMGEGEKRERRGWWPR